MAAIVTAVAVSAAAAVTAGVAMASQVQTAATINQVIQQTSTILESQSRINQHILSGILAANQRIDLLQAQVEELSDLVHLGCIDQRAHLCITSVRFYDSRNASRIIGEYLSGTWSMEAENLIQSQLTQIAVLNSTRVDPVTLGCCQLVCRYKQPQFSLSYPPSSTIVTIQDARQGTALE
ncbi:uncharacterized protein LOC131424313 [Marmota monax]|uniref:uncharacterized protein LOC131424313 n=1 Tax=Marmota monax TaxID=9995 RepID=UPI0026EAF767|nr:uncharacterized protein LOC131424313 [Marmota monax]